PEHEGDSPPLLLLERGQGGPFGEDSCQRITDRSTSADKAWRPSGARATLLTGRVCSAKRPISLPVLRSHRRTVWSMLPESARRPSGVTETQVISCCWLPRNVCFSCPVLASQTRSVPSRLAETMSRSSGVKA